MSGERDQLRADAFDDRKQSGELFGLATIRERDEDIVFRHASQVAVDRLGGMHPVARCARRGKRRGEFLADNPRLAHPCDDDASLTLHQQRHRLLKRAADPRDEPTNRVGFNAKDFFGAAGTLDPLGLTHLQRSYHPRTLN